MDRVANLDDGLRRGGERPVETAPHRIPQVNTDPAASFPPPRHRVAVIGGGWAGMAAAVELAAAGAGVTVYEAAKTLGGRARRVEVDGTTLDNGLHILSGAYLETLRLIETVRRPGEPLGLARMPLTLRIEPGLRLRAPRLPAPLHLAVALIGAKGLDAAEKLAALRFIGAQSRAGFRCDALLTVRELLSLQRQPQRLVDLLWVPLCVAALNTAPDEASAQVFLTVLRDALVASRAASDLLFPTMDFSALFPERARRFVEARGGTVRTGETVRDVQRARNGWRVGEEGEAPFSHAILAVGPHRLDRVLKDVPELAAVRGCVDTLAYRPIYSIYLQYPRAVRLPAPMIGLIGGLGHWAFDRGRLLGQAGLIGVVISGAGPHELLDNDALAARIHDELAARWPLPAPVWSRVIAEKRATFACTPGARRPGNRTPLPTIFLAGDYTESEYPATLEAAVRSGVRAAGMILDDIRRQQLPAFS